MATVMERTERDRKGGLAPEESAAPKQRRRIGPIVLGVLAVVGVVFGVRHWLFTRHHVSTDNAQVEGHITPVLARVGAYVSGVRVEDNQQVKAGDTLVVLDDRDLRARLAQADADLAALKAAVGANGRTGQAVAQLAASRAGASAAQAAVTQARANADRTAADLQRYRALAEKSIISKQQLDAAQAAADAAQAQLLAAQRNAQGAQDQIASASAALVAADAKVASAEAARDQVLLQLSYTRITAPAGGLVAKKAVEVGQLVQPGQPLLSVVPLNDVWVVANLKETEVEHVRAGDPVDIEVDAYPGHTFKGAVESVSPATGAKFSLLPPDNATGNFTKVVQRIPVRIKVDGRQDPARPLRPGMSSVITIETH
jgi:membrane fusion protein (multidrug efflux system)